MKWPSYRIEKTRFERPMYSFARAQSH